MRSRRCARSSSSLVSIPPRCGSAIPTTTRLQHGGHRRPVGSCIRHDMPRSSPTLRPMPRVSLATASMPSTCRVTNGLVVSLPSTTVSAFGALRGTLITRRSHHPWLHPASMRSTGTSSIAWSTPSTADYSHDQWLNGQIARNARPTTRSSSISPNIRLS